jgi:hypothetical protein
VLVLLWMLRSFSVLPAAVGDGTVSIAAALALFLLPAHWPRPPCVPCGDFCSPAWHHKRHVKPVPRVLDWSDSKNVGWGVLLILGGGFALAAGMRKAGLTATVSLLLGALQNVHPLVLVLVIVTTITFMTELMSNVAVANLLLPVLGATAVAAHQNPLLLMAPATISCSFAFMLPVRDQLFILFWVCSDCVSGGHTAKRDHLRQWTCAHGRHGACRPAGQHRRHCAADGRHVRARAAYTRHHAGRAAVMGDAVNMEQVFRIKL